MKHRFPLVFAGWICALSASALANTQPGQPGGDWQSFIQSVSRLKSQAYDPALTLHAVKKMKNFRKLAAPKDYTERDLQPDFVQFRDRLLNSVKTADDLDALLTEADKNYDTYSTDLKYFVAQMELIRPFRSIVYRFRKLFEFEHVKIVQATSVSWIKSLASSMRIYLPSNQWEAGFAYLTEPSRTSADTNYQFTSIQEFQTQVGQQIENELATAITRIQAIYAANLDHPLVWDNKVIFGVASFPGEDGGMDRFRAIYYPEIALTLSSLYLGEHNTEVFCAYNQDDALKVAHDISTHFGVTDGIASLFTTMKDQNLGASSKEMHDAFMAYPKFLTLNPNGTVLMEAAFTHLSTGVKYMQDAWTALGAAPEDAYAFLDPAQILPFRRQIELRLANFNAMIAGKTPINNPVTGEVIDVNLPYFFSEAGTPRDLKVLLPTAFDGANRSDTRTLTTSYGQSLEYRDYFVGRATAWNSTEWSKYFSLRSSAANGSPDMAATLRALRQSWGTDVIAPMVDFFVR